MKIAFDSHIFGLQKYGGISKYHMRLAQGLGNLNKDVRIFAPLYRNDYIRSLSPEMVSGFYVGEYPHKLVSLMTSSNKWFSQLMMDCWNPSLVHETYYVPGRVSRKNCPTVLTVHDLIPEIFNGGSTQSDDVLSAKKNAIDRCDHIICVSENTKNDLFKYYDVSASKVSVVKLGVDQFDIVEDLVDSNNLDKPFLLYVGNRAGYKNFEGLLKAVASSKFLLSDFNIVAFGGGKFTVDELLMMKSLKFHDGQVKHVTGNDLILAYYYKNASAFIFPSMYEGFGIPPLEAMANKCPVISSNTSSMPEVIGDAGHYFNPNSIDDMRSAIEEVVYSEAMIRLLKMNGLIQVAKFSWSKCAEKTLAVYEELVNTKVV